MALRAGLSAVAKRKFHHCPFPALNHGLPTHNLFPILTEL